MFSRRFLNRESVKNRIVVIVDDDLEITILFREALKDIEGISLFTFTDPILALEHFQLNEYAYVLVISDFKMPGLNGLEFLSKVK
jgi:two-component system cell cycle response regulator CpdR